MGFVGLGNVGGKLATNLLNAGFALTVRDLDHEAMKPLLEGGATTVGSGRELADDCDVVITCLPTPAASATVLEQEDGVIAGMSAGKIWAEMSTTDATEVTRLGALVEATGARAIDCPVSGGCHRAATGNISIFAGADRPVFERMLPILTTMGRQVLHTGPLGTASKLKVVTNYLASAHLAALSEALITTTMAGLDLGIAYEAIRISSGNSFVHETEGQLILNGSRAIDFTMDLVVKDVELFHELARDLGVPLEISPVLVDIFRDGLNRYGPREWSSNIIRRLEDTTGLEVTAPGFPAYLQDTESPAIGAELRRSST